MTVGHLQPLVRLVADKAPTRKPELVAFLTDFVSRPDNLRRLYDGLEALGQQAVQEAAHDPKGWLHRDRFVARYGQMPAFSTPAEKKETGWPSYRHQSRPTTLCLFFPHHDYLPTDVRSRLLAFVPRPSPFALPTRDEVPETITLPQRGWRKAEKKEEEALRVRATEQDAQ